MAASPPRPTPPQRLDWADGLGGGRQSEAEELLPAVRRWSAQRAPGPPACTKPPMRPVLARRRQRPIGAADRELASGDGGATPIAAPRRCCFRDLLAARSQEGASRGLRLGSTDGAGRCGLPGSSRHDRKRSPRSNRLEARMAMRLRPDDQAAEVEPRGCEGIRLTYESSSGGSLSCGYQGPLSLLIYAVDYEGILQVMEKPGPYEKGIGKIPMKDSDREKAAFATPRGAVSVRGDTLWLPWALAALHSSAYCKRMPLECRPQTGLVPEVARRRASILFLQPQTTARQNANTPTIELEAPGYQVEAVAALRFYLEGSWRLHHCYGPLPATVLDAIITKDHNPRECSRWYMHAFAFPGSLSPCPTVGQQQQVPTFSPGCGAAILAGVLPAQNCVGAEPPPPGLTAARWPTPDFDSRAYAAMRPASQRLD
uniref:Uncharacterized protein n=1 Tax=Sphaerodactylus townsendi TaxID=933632 RepID=A0ACB8ES49_9SAUR